MKCFYHSRDLDGFCSGAIVKIKYPECELFGMDYHEEFPWDKVERGEKVFTVDFCLVPFENMIKLNEISDLVWIDHHISTIREYEASGDEIEGIRDVDYAACELAWEYLFPDRFLPRAVFLLGRYDVWKLQEDPDVLPFQYGCRLYDLDPKNPKAISFWNSIFKSSYSVNKIVEKGEIVLEYQKQQNKKLMESRSFETELNGYKVIACNTPFGNSQIFDSLENKDKYDIMMVFSLLPSGDWTISLYTEKEDIDVSEISRKFGGGGHKAASGHLCRNLSFLDKN